MKLHNMCSFRGINSDSTEHAHATHVNCEFSMRRHITIPVCDYNCCCPSHRLSKTLKAFATCYRKAKNLTRLPGIILRTLVSCAISLIRLVVRRFNSLAYAMQTHAHNKSNLIPTVQGALFIFTSKFNYFHKPAGTERLVS